MAVSARQAELFAGESWQVIYQSFTQVNFNATDPVSINNALRAYIQVNYPESYNDWIVSSEFVALIDLLSWLAGTLAFKTDLVARENFIDTAEARESILRLARFLSYNPSRCQPATGILKIVSVSTDDDVFDSFGVNQANNTIMWNDPNNRNWFEQLTSVLNNAFISTNPFGIPLKSGSVANIATQLYRVNGFTNNTSFKFSGNVGGTGMDFEVCNGDFSDLGNLFERPPNPLNAFHLYYLNDTNGNSSTRTGFFLLFKQGTTQRQVFNITVPVENQLLHINATNINQNDVWVQSVDDDGMVTTGGNWTKVVPAILNANVNITFNNIPTNQRNIFAALTRDNDQVSIRFSDGRFGNAPVGNIQVTYRVSNGSSYQIRPLEIDNITLPVTFINRMGIPKTLSLTFSLFESVANASAAESIEQIRHRAPQVYATQNRMVSGEDYNSFPLASNLAAKIKAVNRVYSGQSRYIDLHDPTGTYQDLSLFVEDGILFRNPSNIYLEVPASLIATTDDIISNYILPAVDNYNTISLISDVLIQNVLNGTIAAASNTWTISSANLFETSGWFSSPDNLIQPGAIIRFVFPTNEVVWVAVIDIPPGAVITTVPAINTAGPVTLAREVPTGSRVQAIIPSASVQLSPKVLATITEKIDDNLSFTLWYDYSNSNATNGPTWIVQEPLNDFGDPDAILVGNQLLMMIVNRRDSIWRINARGLRWVVESIDDIEWFDSGHRSLTQQTGGGARDLIRVMGINRNLNDPAGYALNTDYDFAIDRLWLYPDGTPEPRRSSILFHDSDEDGYPDDPDAYYKVTEFGFPFRLATNVSFGATTLTLVSVADLRDYVDVGDMIMGFGIVVGTQITAVTTSTITLGIPLNRDLTSGSIITIGDPGLRCTYLFWSNADNPPYDRPLYTVIGYDTDTLRMADTPAIGTIGFQDHAATHLDDHTFWVYNLNTSGTDPSWQQDVTGTYRVEKGRGPNVAAKWVTNSHVTIPSSNSIVLHWKHYAPSDHRIDPSQTNIHDIFVLTFAYDMQVRRWIDGSIDARPLPPTELELRLQFNSLEPFKMFSDQIVWRPVRYKYLFGKGADQELRAQFKVIRLPNVTTSDGEIKSRIITAIDTYFSVVNWDFGETFYFTELAAYIHQQLTGLIGSVVIVPEAASATFGDGFEVTCRSDEIFISTAQVSNIVIIPSNTAVNLRIRS